MSLQHLTLICVKKDEEGSEEQNQEEDTDKHGDKNIDDEEKENGQHDEIFSCKYCQFETEDIDQLDEHILSHDEALFDEDVTEDTEVVTREHKKEHVISQDTPKISFAYNEHEKALNIYVFVCPYPQCNYQSSKRRTMNMHCTSHCKSLKIPITYACSECCYKTRRRDDMCNHLLIHCESIVVSRYKCSECSYAAKRKSDLNKHKFCHLKHLPGYTSRRELALMKHINIHGIAELCNPEFNCTECGYSSKRLYNLNKHVILHSNKYLRDMKGIFKCLNCSYMTPENLSFAKHVLRNCSFVENGVTILADSAEQNYELEEYI